MGEVEAMDRSRRRMLWTALVGFAIWQGLQVAGEVVELTDASYRLHDTLKGVGLVGWVTWSAALLWNWRLARRVRAQPSLQAPLNDEFVRYARLRGFATAFWAMLVTQALVLLASTQFLVPASLGAQTTILVGVSVGLGSFLLAGQAPADA